MISLRPLMLATIALAAAANSPAQSLQEVYTAAQTYDATYLAARAQAEAALYRSRQSNALRRPVIGLNGTATRTETDPPPSTFNPSGARVNNTSSGVVINARQPLFNLANAASIDQAERSLEAAQADLRIAEHELAVRTAQTYFEVLVAQDTLAAAQASQKAIDEQLASAKRNFEVGTATITDTREAQARYDLATAAAIAAENDLRTKRIALDQLIGRGDVTARPLATPVTLPVLQPATVEDWVGLAQANHPALRKAELGLAIAQLESDKARAGHLPTLDAVASLGSNHVSGSQGSLSSLSGLGTTSSASLGLQLAVPLFSGFAVQNRVKETLALEEKARNDLEAARRAVAQGTRVAFFGYQSGQAQVLALEAAESSSKLALEATLLGYRVGVRVNLDVLNAQTQLFNTQRDLSRARYEVLLGGLRLRQAAGTLQAADIGAIDALMSK
jgi:outer membrane protein